MHPFALLPGKRNVHDSYDEFRERYNEQQDSQEIRSRVTRLIENEEILRKRLNDLHIDYDFPGFVSFI